MSIEKKIEPFKIIYGKKNTSIILNVGEYRAEIFAEREAEGCDGNGYDWASLAAVFLDEKMPDLKLEIQFDPEGGMFCAYSKNSQALENFAIVFHAMCTDKEQMQDLFSRTVLD